MTLVERARQRESERQQVLRDWAAAHSIDLSRLDTGQQWVLFAALKARAALGSLAPLRRVLGFLLSHCGMDLGSQAIAGVVEVSDRAIRQTQALSAEELLHKVRHPPGGNRPAKLQPEHAGPVAKYLVLTPQARAPEVLEFIRRTYGIELERHALRDYLLRYGLSDLHGGEFAEPPPPFWAPPSMAAPSSC